MRPAESVDFRAVDLLTRQTDYRSLCRAALQVVHEICPTARAEFLEVFDTEGQDPADVTSLDRLAVRRLPARDEAGAIPVWLPAALGTARQGAHVPSLGPDRAGACTHVFSLGTLAGVARLIVVEGPLDTPGEVQALGALMGICANCFGLLDKFERDPLTGLLNRQSFDYRFEDLLLRFRDNPRRSYPDARPWLAIADIDHFKRINDTHGHLFGDEILLLFSRVMRESFRFDDLLFRYGGEEFIVILNNTDAGGAAGALERFRRAVEGFDFPRGALAGSGTAAGRVTVSLGWVGIRVQEMPVNLLHKADRALYRAKDLGRNRIVGYEAEFGAEDTAPPAGTPVEFFGTRDG